MICVLCREDQPQCHLIYGGDHGYARMPNIIMYHFIIQITAEDFICVPCWNMIEPFQNFFARILNIHFGAESPFSETKISNPDLQMVKEMGMLQQHPTTSTSSVDNAKPMVIINMTKSPDRALVTATVKNGDEEDFGNCLIKLEPYELQDHVQQNLKVKQNYDVDVSPIHNSPSASHFPITIPRRSDTVNNNTPNNRSSTPTSYVRAQTDSNLPNLPTPYKTQSGRITRLTLKKMNDFLLTPIKKPNRISKRRQTDATKALAGISRKPTRRKTIDVNPFENGQPKTFKLNFPAYLNLAPLIYHGTKKPDKKLPPAPPPPPLPLKTEEHFTKTNKFEATKSSKRVLKVLENAGGLKIHRATNKPKAPTTKAKPNNNMKIINKPYKCSVCDKCYRASVDLHSHMSHHTGEPAFKCKLCEYHCLNIKTIKKHAIKVHNSVFSL